MKNIIMKEEIKQRHKNCKEIRCRICLEDAELLEKRLSEQTGTGNKYDLLGEYHKWLAENNIPNETEFGWSSKETYLEKNINAFCESFTLEVKKQRELN